ncbi:MAG: hypothetical protein L0I24_19870, partial [Pseudonocardia sp.]|nr:hypothetical protein [Pseudonocardia sp.]
VRAERLDPEEIVLVDGLPVTSPLRTALTLACRPSLLGAVIGLDALAHRFEFEPLDVIPYGYRRLWTCSERGSVRVRGRGTEQLRLWRE